MEHQFDGLAKALAEGMSRREALRRVGSGLAAALFVSLGWSREAWGETRAMCKSVCGGLGRYGNQCMSVCMSCSSVSCVIGPAGAKTCLQCTGGKVCSSGTCQCPADSSTECDGVCVDTRFDFNHCGDCNTACSPICDGDLAVTRYCSWGTCQRTIETNCAAFSQICLNGACVSR